MLSKIMNNEKFSLLMKMHVYECIDFLLTNKINFSIVANCSLITFTPNLPESIKDEFKAPMIVFALAGYTFESAKISQDTLSFEAGFGNENFESKVSLPLGAIVQIMVEQSPILVNFSTYESCDKKCKKDDNELKKSMSIFKSNPNNKDILK